MKHSVLKEQIVPIALTILTFGFLCLLVFTTITILNLFPSSEKIELVIHPSDVLVGLTIYLKTAIDFAIFIGNLMHSNPGYKKRIAIEIGTACGNALGTIAILTLWNFFREVPWLMALMIIIASLVLLRMAQESLEEFLKSGEGKTVSRLKKPLRFIETQLGFINTLFKPALGKLIPEMSMTDSRARSFFNLAWFSFTIPFILGLDDFAGYIPLFSIINVFGFSIGIFLGHMILNVALFISPDRTTKVVRHPIILAVGGLAFVGIALWGFYEVSHILLGIIHH